MTECRLGVITQCRHNAYRTVMTECRQGCHDRIQTTLNADRAVMKECRQDSSDRMQTVLIMQTVCNDRMHTGL